MMVRVFAVVLFNVIFLNTFSQSSTAVNIIPRPVSLKAKQGIFRLDKNTAIVVKDEGDKDAADFFNDYLQKFYGFTLNIGESASGNHISLSTKKFIKAPENDEHYTLDGTSKSIVIQGDSYDGTFRGVQSLIQLLPVKKSTSLQVPLVSINDQPRLKYRGLMLDVARHFFDVEFVKQYIDFIALHKMNTFHWHLTDDQGWRVEIKKYPKLTEVGAYRDGTIIGHYPGTGNDNIRYGGFYTQDQIRDVVAYATKRHITVIPEIEMPGHAKAALASYPYLGCTGGPYKVLQTWGVEPDVFCAGNDSVFTFLQDVLDEVIPLFPSQYVHVGGDECPKDRWKTCPKCQKRIKENGLKDEHELQSYFVHRMEKYINSKGKKIIGWDEILEGGLAPNATVMSWRGEEGGIEAAKQDHDVIMTPGSHVYLDHAQSKKEDSLTIGGYISVQKVYSYEPVPPVLNDKQKKRILGAQGNLWTEYITNPRKVEYMIFPRVSALSEVLWTPAAAKNWNDFEKRLKVQFKRYDLWGVNYSRALFTDMRVKFDPKKKIASK
jgi:hexosaminidase